MGDETIYLSPDWLVHRVGSPVTKSRLSFSGWTSPVRMQWRGFKQGRKLGLRDKTKSSITGQVLALFRQGYVGQWTVSTDTQPAANMVRQRATNVFFLELKTIYIWQNTPRPSRLLHVWTDRTRLLWWAHIVAPRLIQRWSYGYVVFPWLTPVCLLIDTQTYKISQKNQNS